MTFYKPLKYLKERVNVPTDYSEHRAQLVKFILSTFSLSNNNTWETCSIIFSKDLQIS